MNCIRAIVTTICVASLAAVSCSRNNESNSATVTVPRRTGYPRVTLPAPAIETRVVAGTRLALNTIGTVTTSTGDSGNRFVTVDYPAPLDSRLLLTLVDITPGSVSDIIDNRIERINLNLSGNRAERYVIDDDGITGQLVVSERISTPAQFYITDNRSRLLSGSIFMPALNDMTADSLAPLTDYLITDVATLIDNFATDVTTAR